MAFKAFRGLGMVERTPGIFSRHPLAFLTEAADDVCYAVADIEDGFKLGIVTFQEVCDVLLPLASAARGFSDKTYLDNPTRLAIIRAAALSVLVSECIEAFRGGLEEMETGVLEVPLLDRTHASKQYQAIKKLAKEKVYRSERVLQIEYAGYQTIGGLLEMFYQALCESGDGEKEEKLRKLFPIDFLKRPRISSLAASEERDPVGFYLNFMTQYERLLAVTDYISGMTDRFAVQLFQRLSGIRLPE
jgi:dGTPase